jgi:CMP-N-acetylneuraminic acid synthetase
VDIVVMVQATSPLILPEFLKNGARKMLDEGWDSVFSVNRLHKFRWADNSGTGNRRTWQNVGGKYLSTPPNL